MGSTSSVTGSPGRSGRQVAHRVVSVGPYMCRTTTPGHASRTRATDPAGTTSPPVSTSRRPAKQSGDSSATTRNRPAVRCTAVTPAATASRTRRASTVPGAATTTRPPVASGAQISYSEASKTCGACSSTASSGPSAQPGSAASPATLPCGTPTPLGTPVEPEVYITYAKSPVDIPGCGDPAGHAATAARTSGVSSTTTCPAASAGTAARVASVHSTTDGPESASMNATRSAGYPASTGTYAAPAFQMPSSTATRWAERSISTATRSPRPTPRPPRYAARRSDSVSNSP